MGLHALLPLCKFSFEFVHNKLNVINFDAKHNNNHITALCSQIYNIFTFIIYVIIILILFNKIHFNIIILTVLNYMHDNF